jgi:tRNA(Ile)-lysidine synthase
MVPDDAFVARFAADLDRLSSPDGRIGLAVSGGPDSLALLLLAAAARPGLVEAATVDHQLRPESGSEAAMVAAVCADLAVSHRILTIDWPDKPQGGLQARARDERYRLLAGWVRERQLTALVTAHHRDDQAETLLMRLARGSGVRGLAAMRPASAVPGAADIALLRPLLGWSHAEIVALCEAAGKVPADDPSNRDETYERVRVRAWIADSGLDTEAVARSAAHLRSADEAIAWAVEREWSEAVVQEPTRLTYLAGTAPAEIRRRIIARAIAELASEGGSELRGRELDHLLDTLQSGSKATLRGVLCSGGATWCFERAPGRSSACG